MLYFIYLIIHLSFVRTTPESVQVKQADIELNQLILAKNANKAAAFYADDFILTTSSGRPKYKQQMLAEIGSADLQLEINESSHVEVRRVASTAILTGTLHQRGTYKGKTFDVWLLVTDTWIHTGDGWKILSGHASQKPDTEL